MPKIEHYRYKCIGCNSCVTIAPQNWIMDEKDGKSKLVCSVQKKNIFIANIFEQDKAMNKMAAKACPMNIIKVLDYEFKNY